jgi:hypothetical protein
LGNRENHAHVGTRSFPPSCSSLAEEDVPGVATDTTGFGSEAIAVELGPYAGSTVAMEGAADLAARLTDDGPITKYHNNDLRTTTPAQGYVLVDKSTGEIKKIRRNDPRNKPLFADILG